MNSQKIEVSLGVFVYNEEKNIGKLLESIEKQRLDNVRIQEVIVISSGSYDRTNKILREWQQRSSKIKLILEVNRRGKSAAVNMFLRSANAPIVITISGDLLLHRDAIEEISLPFLHEDVGMVGAHPIPKNIKQSGIGREVELLWELHHRLSLTDPKCGEMVALRNIVREIPLESAVDEATLEVLLKIVGYKVVYAPRSIVYNKGPISVNEFLIQRRRVYAGHEWVTLTYNYQVASMNTSHLANLLWEYAMENPRSWGVLIRLTILEVMARGLGFMDYHILGKNPYKWKMISR
jgi:cellulose synthase/poly-beta-1,6-N-acetylglucosamine synthase-like glycosyltransferase